VVIKLIYTVIFYGSIFLSILFLTFSLLRNSRSLMFISVLLSLPFSIYLSLIPAMRWVILVPVIYILIFYCIRKTNNSLIGKR